MAIHGLEKKYICSFAFFNIKHSFFYSPSKTNDLYSAIINII